MECDIRFSLQGRYPSELDLSTFGITNTAVTIHGFALHAGKGITEDDFINKKEGDIAQQLVTYLDNRPSINPGLNHLVILDMEPSYPDPADPTGKKQINFSPKNLGRYDACQQIELIRAYRRRIKVARGVLRDRGLKVKLGLYGIIVPMGKGQENEEFQTRMKAYRCAGQLGMYDLLDYLVPVLYTGFGPSDIPGTDCDSDLDTLHTWIEKATHQAITKTQELTRRNGKKVPLAPILTFWTNNGKSAHDNKVICPATLDLQLRILQEFGAVEIIVLWSGSETMEEMSQTEFEPVDISVFLGQVNGLPFPGCT
jgi:hypothetical protein